MLGLNRWKCSSQPVEDIDHKLGLSCNSLCKLYGLLTGPSDAHSSSTRDILAPGPCLKVDSLCLRIARSKVGVDGTEFVRHALGELAELEHAGLCEIEVTRLHRRTDKLGMLQNRFPFFPLFRSNVERYLVRCALAFGLFVGIFHCPQQHKSRCKSRLLR